MAKPRKPVVNPVVRTWIDPDGGRIEDQALLAWVVERSAKVTGFNSESKVVVGTDSHIAGRSFRFVTVVCVYNVGSGGYFYYTVNYEDRDLYKNNKQHRMFQEVQKSIEVCDWIAEATLLIPEIHIDASPPDRGEFTSSFSDALVGFAKGSGYVGVVKDGAFAASCIADKYTRS